MTMESIPMDDPCDVIDVVATTSDCHDNNEVGSVSSGCKQQETQPTRRHDSSLPSDHTQQDCAKNKCYENEEVLTVALDKSDGGEKLSKKLREDGQTTYFHCNVQKDKNRHIRRPPDKPQNPQWPLPVQGFVGMQSTHHGNQHGPRIGSPPRGSVPDRRGRIGSPPRGTVPDRRGRIGSPPRGTGPDRRGRIGSPPRGTVSDRRGSISSGLSCPVSRSGSSRPSTPQKRLSRTLSGQNMSTVSEGPVCRICHEGDMKEVLVSPCYCAGSLGLLHISCLQTWLGSSNKTACEICNFHFALCRKPMSFKQFLKDPGSVKDKKHLVCDILSFLIITPLTIITTYMCLAGAMKYYTADSWERGGLVGLAVSLILLFSFWLVIALRHNWRLWKDWRLFHQEVTLLCTPDQRNNQTSHNMDMKSNSVSTRSTVGSVQIQSIKISMQGSMKQFKAGHRLKGHSGETTDTLPTIPRHCEEVAVIGPKRPKNELRSDCVQHPRDLLPDRTQAEAGSSKSGKSSQGHPTFYSPKAKYAEEVEQACYAAKYAEAKERAYYVAKYSEEKERAYVDPRVTGRTIDPSSVNKGKAFFYERPKAHGSDAAADGRFYSEASRPVTARGYMTDIHWKSQKPGPRSSVVRNCQDRNVDRLRPVDHHGSYKCSKPVDAMLSLPKGSKFDKNSGQNWDVIVRGKSVEDPLMSPQAAIFSRGNSPIVGTSTQAATTPCQPDRIPSMEYTQDWVNGSPSVGEALSSGSGATDHTHDKCSCMKEK